MYWVLGGLGVLIIVVLIILLAGGGEKKEEKRTAVTKDAVALSDVQRKREVEKKAAPALATTKDVQVKKDVVSDRTAVSKDATKKDAKTAEGIVATKGDVKGTKKEEVKEPQKPSEKKPVRESGFVYASDLVCPPGMVKIVLAKKMKKDAKFKPRKLAYCIDKYEYPGKGKTPAGRVSKVRAAALCKKAGKRLCTPSEWLRACGPKFSYGKTFQKDYCNVDSGTIVPSGSNSKCRSPYGVYDMVGNAEEWTSDGKLRGGSGQTSADMATCRYSTKRLIPGRFTGFRCCAYPKLPEEK